MNTRITFLITAAAAATGCGATDLGRGDTRASASAIVQGGVSFEANGALANEHCALPEALRDSVGIGRQARLVYGSPARHALCTVDSIAAAQGDGGVARAEMNTSSLRKRFNIDPDASVPSTIPNVQVMNEVPGVAGAGPIARAQTGAAPDFTFDAPDVQEWNSALPASADRVIYTAPHAIMETNTQHQMTAALTNPAPWEGAWIAMHRQTGGSGALNAFHITSTDLSDESFPGLGGAITAGYRYAVSFHGFSDCAACGDVFIGGGASSNFRNGLADVIREVLPASVSVVVASSGGLAGAEGANFVNRLANGHGVQLEQSEQLRNSGVNREAVVSATRIWHDCLIEPADVPNGSLAAVNTSYQATVPWNYGSGRCPRATVEIDAAVSLDELSTTPSACAGNYTLREDFFRRRPDLSYERIGGGSRHGVVGANGLCTWVNDSNYIALQSADLAPGHFRVVGRFLTDGFPRPVTVRAKNGTPPLAQLPRL
ncbi:MAG: poly-gamma-glutamate hydrolase family protein [Polyangiales bacterium]